MGGCRGRRSRAQWCSAGPRASRSLLQIDGAKNDPQFSPFRRFYRICGVVWFIMHPAMIYFAGVLAGFSIGRQQVASIGIGLPRRGRRGRDSRRGGRDWTRSSCPGRSSVRNPRPGSASSQRARRREQAARNGMHGMIGPSRRRRRRD